jgi:hypothetical protein
MKLLKLMETKVYIHLKRVANSLKKTFIFIFYLKVYVDTKVDFYKNKLKCIKFFLMFILGFIYNDYLIFILI